jgi:cytochrome c peroxidase
MPRATHASQRIPNAIRSSALILIALISLSSAAAAAADDSAMLRTQAKSVIGTLPADAASEARPMNAARVDLGRQLYYDTRLSKNHDIACNSCHPLDRFGADGEPTSPGHRGQRGGRNSPTVYNAALHIAQFWDGREPDVEAQAKGPVLNPVEMAMPSETAVVAVLKSIPGYGPSFANAFPGTADPITYDNMAAAIGAFERGLLTPAPVDRFIAGDDAALAADARRGFTLFLQNGCVSCHAGPAIGGGMYRKIGLVKPYETLDPGRFDVTGNESDRHVFKVPSLRNITQTGPYFHDGSIESLDEAVRLMGWHQLGIDIPAEDRASIIAFLESLTGSTDATYIAKPELPASGPATPEPDPS